MALESINPATGETINSFDEMSWAHVNEILRCVDEAHYMWTETSYEKRAGHFKKLASVLRDNKVLYAELMAREMGKPVKAGQGECEKCAWLCEHYADHAAEYLAPETVETDAGKSFISYQPLGVIFAIMPWNFPFWQVLRCAVPAIMAGNSVVLKHANNVTECAITIEQMFQEAGFPRDLFRTLVVDIPVVQNVIEHDSVRAVTLTGSVKAGRSVGEISGRALKRCVLELGGSDPFVVLEDANLDQAADVGATSRLQANGESCIAAKRFIVVDDVRAAFVEKLQARMAAYKMGDPLDESTDLGPLARVDLRDGLHTQVSKSVAKGAKLLMGGEVPDETGAWYPPTLLVDVGPGMAAYEEEMFGPAAAVIAASGEDEALRIAADTQYGLGATVFTQDLDRGERIATKGLKAGCCFVNSMVKSDPRLPFGGIKDSGFGRELGKHGIQELTNIKTVYIA